MAMIGMDGNANDWLDGDERKTGGYTGGIYSSPGTPIASAPQTYPTYSGWQDPYNPPNSGDPYYSAWLTGTGQDASKAPAPTGPQLNSNNSPYTAVDPYAWIDETLRSVSSTDDPNYWRRVIGADPNGSGSAKDYWIDRIRRGDGSALVRSGQLQKFQDNGPAASPQQQAPSSYSAGGIFDDPATAPFLKLLEDRVNALNQPHHNPQIDQLNGYLQKYFESLQGPTYTPQQMDLMQTQTLDPLSRERDAARQRVIEQASRRGLSGQSGIVQKQLSDLDNQFEQLRTKTQAGFASKAIDLDRINQQQAAGVAQALANIEQTQFGQNEQRANQALELAQTVPNLARQRLLDANAVLGQNALSPTSLAQIATQANAADSAQTQQFWLTLASLVPGILSLFRKNNG